MRFFLFVWKFWVECKYAIKSGGKIWWQFPIKDKVDHRCCVIYQGTCSCGQIYIGETERCSHVRFSEHCDIKKGSEPAKHIKDNRNHFFTWMIISNAPKDQERRKILEALYVSKFKPSINDQIKSKKLKLYPNGMTWM